MPDLRMNYEDDSSDNDSNSNDEYSTYENRMPNLRMNYEDNCNNDNSDDESVSTSGYGYNSDCNDELDSSDDKSIGDDNGWAREVRAQDLKVVKVHKDRKNRQHSATIQDIYVHKKHRQEQCTTYSTTELI